MPPQAHLRWLGSSTKTFSYDSKGSAKHNVLGVSLPPPLKDEAQILGISRQIPSPSSTTTTTTTTTIIFDTN